MRFNFRKISSVLGSAAMAGSTFALAAAAAYPAPFVSSGSSDVAIVYGSASAQTDYAAALNIGSDLSATLASQSVSVGGSVATSGETAPLFASTKLYINDSLNAVKNSLTKSQLPTVLADQTFSGIVDAKATHTLTIGPTTGGKNLIGFDKMPTSSDDPRFGVVLGVNAQTQPLYNATASFSKAVDFTNASSKGQDIVLFGQKFTVASETTSTKLVLLKSATRINLDTDSPSQDVTVGGKKYTVTLISASDTAATVRVTDDAGVSDQKEINEAASKKVQGLTVAITTADETNLKLSASIVAGAEKISLQDGSNVYYGEDDKPIDGTQVDFGTTTSTTNITGITVSAAAESSDEDAITPGNSFVDPVYGSFKVDFAGMNIPDSSDSRENIKLRAAGDDKVEVTFKNWGGNEKTLRFATAVNVTNAELRVDDSGNNLTVIENGLMYRNGYVVVGNEDEGYLLKLSTVTNDSSTTAGYNDRVAFSDFFSGSTYESQSTTTEGSATVSIGGKDFTATYSGASTNSDTIQVTLNYPDSSGNSKIIYPPIETSKGAKLFFYQPLTINLTREALSGANLMFPDGDGYTNVAVAQDAASGNFTFGGSATALALNVTGVNSGSQYINVSVGRLTYTFANANMSDSPLNRYSSETAGYGPNMTVLYMTSPEGSLITQPAVVIFEEKDDDNDYEAVIIDLEAGSSSDDGIGVNEAHRTWDSDNTAWEYNLASDSKKATEADLWGTTVLTDSADSDQKTATLSYPDEQLYAQIYVSALDASVSAGGSSTIVPVKDSEVSGVSSKNLLVIGGSCVNTVAARLLGSDSPLCSAEFTSKTGVGSGEYLIQTFASPYSDSKIATLVAGYEAADTTNAVNSLKSNKPEIAVGKKFKGTTASSLTAA